MNGETVAALSTAPQKAALGIIRVSGEDAFEIVGKIFDKQIPAASKTTVIHGKIIDGEEAVDDVLLTAFYAPKSYTGENVVEISCHGGTYNCHRILKLLIQNGARQAQNGEFSKRAFINGKIDLTQAEAVINLIDSETRAEAAAANSHLDGVLSRKINEIREDLLAVSAKLLAFIDYPDDEIEDTPPEMMLRIIRRAHFRVDRLVSSYDTGKIVKDGIKTVVAGKPNVGKSTLTNLLCGEERSIVTDIAGTTRDVIETFVRIKDLKLRVFDTAGIRSQNGENVDAVEKIGIERTLQKIKEADLILCVFDAASDSTKEDEMIYNEVKNATAKKIFILNKVDKINESRLDRPLKKEFEFELPLGFTRVVKKQKDSGKVPPPSIQFSAKTGEGFDELCDMISCFFTTGEELGGEIITDLRHFQCLTEAKSSLENALENPKMTPDALLFDVENAINALGILTGKKASEEIIETIFSKFCVGK